MKELISTLVKRLAEPEFAKVNVIPWSSPVPTFGDLSKSQVATLGLNPSNREFLDRFGNELTGPVRRFHTLGSLGIPHWSEANGRHSKLIWESCQSYFFRNPYDLWFRQLDYLIADTNTSYYQVAGQACHLDLVPYATTCKWTCLKRKQQMSLLAAAGHLLAELLRYSPVRILVLNGNSVVKEFESIAGVRLDRRSMPGWSLRRGSRASVAGVAYRGTVSNVAGTALRRDILVVGFNHNIQSSFGVTHEVRASIRRWIGHSAQGVLREAQRSVYRRPA